ncbi:phage tail tube protein [Rhodopseudomonas sp. RCAM05734]|uniref:phage tail tube protein n=1 Tax=Rhodopseudomonas sp. RCAM05734 TaxID=3457549 RepID=UPI0040443754
MSGLAESVSERLVYKIYASPEIDSSTEPVASVAPGASGGQVLRHVSHNLALTKDNYRPNEKREDAQQTMGKHGSRTVPGTINGFLSPGTHQDLFAAVMRSVWSTPIALDETDFTSVAFDATAKTATFVSGDPVALGLQVGMIAEFGALATAENNRGFLILGFSGSNNRVVNIYPAPVTQTADTAFTLATAPVLLNPATQAERTNYKVAFEVNNPDIDLSRFYTECRIGGFDLSIGVNANVGLNFSLLGRNRQVLTGAAAPFFTAPTAETTTDIPTAMQGLLMLGGLVIGVVTGLNIKADLGPEAAKAINPDGLVAGILLGDFVCSGDFTLFLTDGVALSAFDDETELALLAYLPSSNTASAPANAFFLPRIKVNSNGESEVNKAKAIQCQFEAARYVGTAPGIPSTTMMIVDTAVA